MNRSATLRRIAFAGAGFATAAGLPLRTFAQAPLPTIRAGVAIADSYAQAFYGDDAGIFRQNGIALDIRPLANSGAIAAAIVGGSLDVGVGSPPQVAAAHENGLPFVFFAPSAVFVPEAPTTLLMVAKNSTIKTAADLNGKTVAADNLKSFPQLSVTAWMQKNGGDPASVKFVEMPFFSMAGALETGRVDAAEIAEPALTASRATCRQLASPFEAIGRSWYLSAWFSTKDWLTTNAALAHRFTQALTQTAVWANGHQKETAVVLERVSKMSHDVVVSMTRSRFGERMDPALMEPLFAVALKGGMLNAPITAKEMIAPGF